MALFSSKKTSELSNRRVKRGLTIVNMLQTHSDSVGPSLVKEEAPPDYIESSHMYRYVAIPGSC